MIPMYRVLSYAEPPRIDLHLPVMTVEYYRVFPDPPVSEELIDDIRAHGILQPLRIYTNGTKAVLRDGHHRLSAARTLEFTALPVHVIPNWLDRIYVGYGLPDLEVHLSEWMKDNLDFTHQGHTQKRAQVNKRLTLVSCSCGASWRETPNEPWETVTGAPRRSA